MLLTALTAKSSVNFFSPALTDMPSNSKTKRRFANTMKRKKIIELLHKEAILREFFRENGTFKYNAPVSKKRNSKTVKKHRKK